MAKTSVFLLSMLLIIASIFSVSHSLEEFLGYLIGGIRIQGILRCSSTGDPNAPPVSGATVVLSCANQTTNLGQAATEPTGIFTFVLTASDTVLYDPRDCYVTANLPGGNCTITPPNGAVTASIYLINYSILKFFAFLNYTTTTFLPSVIVGP